MWWTGIGMEPRPQCGHVTVPLAEKHNRKPVYILSMRADHSMA